MDQQFQQKIFIILQRYNANIIRIIRFTLWVDHLHRFYDTRKLENTQKTGGTQGLDEISSSSKIDGMEQIEIRDLRHKEKFQVDDLYLNGYAKRCGIYATGVYVSLCRHADREQTAWPSLNTMATKLSISKRSVQRALEKLEIHGIILRVRKGKKLNNRYLLLDKSVWTESPLTAGEVTDRRLTVVRGASHGGHTGHYIERKHSSKDTQVRIQKGLQRAKEIFEQSIQKGS